ncbi:MAG: damage-inducible protein CinA [Rickettsiales bacterium]|nr:damage-inducible protein CinA [Rickettsiales bacterium]
MFSDALRDQAAALLEACRQRGWMLATAESCTGGLIAGLLTDIAGSSDVVDRGFVTYANEAKRDMLGVTDTLLDAQGAVSPQVAKAMAEGAIRHSRAQLSIAVTGIAGPGGGSKDKPVGLVHFASAMRDGDTTNEYHVFEGDRSAVRMATVKQALHILQARAQQS